jgi:23S rRNA (cytidine1920-2'-O)/16S rRNA (cytidine1409-2'-O)-methyltransferase
MKFRLDEYLSEREQIDLPAVVTLIMTGKVLVDGRPETKPGRQINDRNEIILKERPREFPARSAAKLLGAIESFKAFALEKRIAGHVCVDLGAAHGGFTRVLLDHGARRVYAVDVARGLLDHTIQRDERVTVLDRHNVKSIDASWFDPADLAEQPWFFSCDISFLSLGSVFEAVARFADQSSISFSGIFLLKPQFEASAQTEKGILRDEALRLQIREQMIARATELGYTVRADADSALAGRKGNVEICLLLEYGPFFKSGDFLDIL